MSRFALCVWSLFALCCCSCVASAPSPAASSTWLTGEIVAIEISNADPSLVTVVVYDPLSGSALASDPIPRWWDDPSVILDGTSAKSVSWSGGVGAGRDIRFESAAPQAAAYIGFLVQNNATVPTQALFTYQFSDASGYIKPVIVSSCVSKAQLMTDLQYFAPPNGALPFAAAYVDMTQATSDTQFAFMSIALPSSANLSEVCEVSLLPTDPAAAQPVPWSVSAVVASTVPGWAPLLWSYVGYTNQTSSNGTVSYAYSISFVNLESGAAGKLPDPIPLPPSIAPSKPPPEPWFSLQLLANPPQLGRQTATDLWLVNSIDQTVYAVTLEGARMEQVTTQSGLPFVIPTIPAAVTFTSTADPAQSDPIFLHLNDYKQLLGACPANASLTITGVNLQQLAWGQKLNFHYDTLVESDDTRMAAE